MARSKEDMQDIALYHMDKLNRRNVSEKPLTGKESLQQELEYANLSSSEKMRRKSNYDWELDLRDLVNKKWSNINYKQFQWVLAKFKKEMKEFHEKGEPYTTVLAFVRDKQMDWMNR
jgi:hypothetical protein